ncbi:hypothetical protein EJ06DRAFT_484782 [Trichodelitschia bisporula]|uniref:Uncharacterized protein n=1 Tax=Trichodelitschia bisporula TaxID=703511 RepID=A0A6G1HI93_9PEZI|nr:hypothetical protein EJ06DRAFT_484782 [Trichodelitschia bisporula]
MHLLPVLFPTLTLAALTFLSPTGGSTYAPGPLTVTWSITNTGPPPFISDASTYQLFLCAGGLDPATHTDLTPLVPLGLIKDGTSITVPIPGDIGASEPSNAYFLKILIQTPTGLTHALFSPRFTLSHMSGTFPAHVLPGLTSPLPPLPPSQSVLPPLTAPTLLASFLVPWTMQEGPTRYASMQPTPGTRITRQSPRRLFGTSEVAVQTGLMAPAQVVTTVTMSVPGDVVGREENTAAAMRLVGRGVGVDWRRWEGRWRD